MRAGLSWIAMAVVAVSLALPLAAQQSGTGNAAAGAKQFLQCRACHTVTKGGANGVGPNLWGVMNSTAASRAGYAFSPAMKSSGIRWTGEAMDAFLAKPNARVPGNKMAFAGMPNAAARRDLVAYLATLK